MMKIKYLLLAFTSVILVVIAGCATERYVSPRISEVPRAGFVLNPPILGAVFDGRITQEPKDSASQLQADLSRIYGSSIEWNEYFTKTPPGRVAVRVRIVTLGATFGSRLVSKTAFANAV